MEKIKNPRIISDLNKVNLICFLLYNFGVYIEKYENEKESYKLFKKGLEFSVSLLGDINLYTTMFKNKLNSQVYSDIKREHMYGGCETITNSISRDSSNLSATNTKSIDKSDDYEDLLSKQLKKYPPKKFTLKEHLEMTSPKSNRALYQQETYIEPEKCETFHKVNLEDSYISVKSGLETSVNKVDDNKSFTMDNFKIEIKQGGTDTSKSVDVSVETIVDKNIDIDTKIVKGKKDEDNRKSSTIDNTHSLKKPSRLKELFSMAAGSTINAPKPNKRNSINERPKILSIFEHKFSKRKQLTEQLSGIESPMKERSKYHELMDNIEEDAINLSGYNKELSTINDAVKKENYSKFISKVSGTMGRLTGFQAFNNTYKIISTLEDEAQYQHADTFYIKDERPEINGKKVDKADFLLKQIGKNLLYKTDFLHPKTYITNEMIYKYFEDENNSNFVLIFSL
jgi:hypothetical protein